jgi:hypothetical protein
MTFCSLRLSRTAFLALVVGIIFAGLALAESAPRAADSLPGKNCVSFLSGAAASQPALNSLGLPALKLASNPDSIQASSGCDMSCVSDCVDGFYSCGGSQGCCPGANFCTRTCGDECPLICYE